MGSEIISQNQQSSFQMVAFFVPKGGMRQQMKEQKTKKSVKELVLQIPSIITNAYVCVMMLVVMYQPAYATDIVTTAKGALQKVYSDIAGLATVGAVACAAVCLFLMNFSKSGRTVDESRAWLKRIVVCWAAIMTLGAIVTYMEALIPQTAFTNK